MKIKNTLMVLSTLALMGTASYGQHTHNITKDYTNEQITEMYNSYVQGKQRDITPSEALSSKLKADFPNAKDIEWETDGKINRAEFEVGDTDYKAYYDSEGKLLMYVHELSSSRLPEKVKEAVLAKNPGFDFDDIKMMHRGTEIFYLIELEKSGERDIKVIYRNDGVLVDRDGKAVQ